MQDVSQKMNKNKKYRGFMSAIEIDTDEHSINFSSETKGEVYINQTYSTVPRCAICGGLLHKNSISIDHITPKRDGGVGSVENGQLTHPFCNTGVKN